MNDELPPMHPAPVIRAASVLSYVVGVGTLLAIGPGLAYNLFTGESVGSLLGMNPSYGDYLGSNPIGLTWGFTGALIFGVAFLVAAALEIVAGFWLGKSLKRGGRLGVVLALAITAFSVGFVLPAWIVVGPILIGLIGAGWRTLH
jgi:hypothetical protein